MVTKDGKRFRSLDVAQETIVGGSKEMHKGHRWVADMYNPYTSYPDGMTTQGYIEQFVPNNKGYQRYVQTIITYYFASQTVDTFSSMETNRAIVDTIEQTADWGTARGGTKPIVEALENVITDHGGEIALSTKVDKILIEGGQAVGVKLADGREIRSQIVIHNAGLNRLISLVGTGQLPADYTNRLKNAVPVLIAALILET